jgi:hypothetical protein
MVGFESELEQLASPTMNAVYRVRSDPAPADLDTYLRDHPNLHHFRLEREVVHAINRNDATLVLKGLADAGILHLPYRALLLSFDIDDFREDPGWNTPEDRSRNRKPLKSVISAVITDLFQIIEDPREPTGYAVAVSYMPHIVLQNAGGWSTTLDSRQWTLTSYAKQRTVDVPEGPIRGGARAVCNQVANAIICLVTALAAKNTVKDYRKNKRLAQGKRPKAIFIGANGTEYSSTTIIRLPTNLPDDNTMRMGPTGPKRAHLRRGHVHGFWTGKKGEQGLTKKWIAPLIVNADASYVAQARQYVVKGGQTEFSNAADFLGFAGPDQEKVKTVPPQNQSVRPDTDIEPLTGQKKKSS